MEQLLPRHRYIIPKKKKLSRFTQSIQFWFKTQFIKIVFPPTNIFIMKPMLVRKNFNLSYISLSFRIRKCTFMVIIKKNQDEKSEREIEKKRH